MQDTETRSILRTLSLAACVLSLGLTSLSAFAQHSSSYHPPSDPELKSLSRNGLPASTLPPSGSKSDASTHQLDQIEKQGVSNTKSHLGSSGLKSGGSSYHASSNAGRQAPINFAYHSPSSGGARSTARAR